METTNIAIIGLGKVAEYLCHNFLSVDGAKVVAVYDQDSSKAHQITQNLKTRLGEVFPQDELDKILDDKSIEAVIIDSNILSRFGYAKQCLDAGKHVMIVKPLALNFGDGLSLYQYAQNHNLILTVCDSDLFYEPFNKVKEIIEKNGIGLTSLLRHRINPSGFGGEWGSGVDPAENLDNVPFVFAPAVDRFTLPIFMLGDIKQTFAYINYTGENNWNVPSALIQWQYKRESLGGTIDYTFSPDLQIKSDGYSVNEMMEISGFNGNVFVHQGWSAAMTQPAVLHIHGRTQTNAGIGLDLDYIHGYLKCLQYFINRIQKKTKSIQTSLYALKGLSFQLAVLQSAKSQQNVMLPDIQI
jgi:predicted dehydrogenase